ncbi:MAG: cellulase family glycosylhydrolase [Bacteroidales bacterium]|nr:cellulase family glycosylhydrolase [Bacteroidales bacterium]
MIQKFNALLIKSLIAISLISLIAMTNSCKETGQQYITASDGMFIKPGGQAYYFIGANYWYGAILGSEGEHGDRARLIRELDHLQSIGVNNLRVLVGAEGPDGEPTRVTPALQLEPGVYNEKLLDGLDFLLAEMKKRDQYAILYLNNSWEWSGGFSQYLNWNGYGPIPYPTLPGNTWPQFMEFAGQFHNCDECINQYHDYIRFILGRTNKYTGLKYTEDPVIMTWEIANEPRAFSRENLPAFKDMIASTASLIKELDNKHLVTTGTEGLHGCEYSMDAFREIHADPNIDYLTMHIWPKNWGWMNPSDVGLSMDSSLNKTNKYMADHIVVARQLNKPIVFEEFGMPRDHYGFSPAESVYYRDIYYKNAFEQLLEHVAARGVLAGCNFWAYSGEGRSGGESIFWEAGDDYLGDPPHEEQGLYSVFDSDTTSINLVAEYNKLIADLLAE